MARGAKQQGAYVLLCIDAACHRVDPTPCLAQSQARRDNFNIFRVIFLRHARQSPPVYVLGVHSSDCMRVGVRNPVSCLPKFTCIYLFVPGKLYSCQASRSLWQVRRPVVMSSQPE
jgi:hypothetical protein